jgi:hypothetical protein
VNQVSTLPSTAEQARHALLLLGAPAAVRLVVDVHVALFDGDLSVAGLAGLVRDRVPGLCAALRPDLTAAPGLVALTEWSLERRIVTPARRRADELAMVLRVAEFVAMRQGAGRAADRLLRELAPRVRDDIEVFDLADAARAALSDAGLAAELAAEEPNRAALVTRAGELEMRHRLYGVPAVPQQRGGG